MTDKMRKKKRKLTILARMLCTCLLAFVMGFVLFTIVYLFSQKFFFIDILEDWNYASQTKVIRAHSFLEDYSVLEKYSFPEKMKLEVGNAVYRDMNTRGNHLIVTMDLFGKKDRITFSSVNKVLSRAHRNGEVLLFVDEFKSYHMAVKSAPCFYPDTFFLRNRGKRTWIAKADPKFPYKEEGFFIQEETEAGYQVIMAVEGETDAGYLKLEYDLENNRLYRFLYLENKVVYSETRAKDTICSATGCINELQRKDCLVLEADKMPESMEIDMVLDGHPFEMMQCSWRKHEIMPEIGVYQTKLMINNEEFVQEVEVRDTTAPQYCESDFIFFEGDKIDLAWIEEQCFEDVSLPVSVSFSNPNQERVVTAEKVKDGVLSVPVLATDANGNSAEYDLSFRVYDNKDLPEWFRFFMDSEDEDLLQRVRCGEMEVIRTEYFETYEEGHWEEMYEEAVEGYKTAVRKNLDIRIEGKEWYGYPLMEVYAGIHDIPDYLLDSYIENGWCINLCDGELLLDDMACAGITFYGEQKIDMTSYYERAYSFRATMIHEFGHYVDWYYDFEIRNDEELREYLVWKREDFGLSEEEVNEWFLEGCVGDPYEFIYGDYRHYSVVLVDEFFADSFFFYCAYPEKFEAEYPHIYRKIDEMVEE